jgi:hypothetical protein
MLKQSKLSLEKLLQILVCLFLGFLNLKINWGFSFMSSIILIVSKIAELPCCGTAIFLYVWLFC